MNAPDKFSSVAKRLIRHGPLTTSFARDHAFILLYHRILPDEVCDTAKANHALLVSTSNFDAHLRYLSENFDVVSLSDLARSLASGELESSGQPKIALTFDDGWTDNYRHAWPILKKYNFPATIFLVSDFIESGETLWWNAFQSDLESRGDITLRGWKSELAEIARRNEFNGIHKSLQKAQIPDTGGADFIINLFKEFGHQEIERFVALLRSGEDASLSRDLITWEQAAEMQAAGIEFGAHTCRHELLTHLDSCATRKTVQGSVEALKQHHINPIPVFSYPNGDNNARVQRDVQDAGFEFAVSTRRGTISRSPKNPMDLPRINIGGGAKADISLLRQRLARAFWLQR